MAVIQTNDKYFISDYGLNKFYNDIKEDEATGVLLWEHIRAKYTWTTYINSLNALCWEFSIDPDETIDYIINERNTYKNTLINRHIHALDSIKNRN